MILIIDFGSQYNQLIARRVRELGVYCQIEPPAIKLETIKKLSPEAIILSGGPASVYQRNAPRCDIRIFRLGVPVLGICYGMQFMVHTLGGCVKRAQKREYGFSSLRVSKASKIFSGIKNSTTCWMSHGDSVTRLPKGFNRIAHTSSAPYAAIEDRKQLFYGVQFHPEVVHTPRGKAILKNFLFRIAKCKPSWDMKYFVRESVREIRHAVGKNKVVLGLSGGVDSSVTAVLLHKAIGRRLVCIFVDNGLLRKYEAKRVRDVFKKHFKMNLIVVNAEERFLKRLRGIEDPEKKRKVIGREFVQVFEKEAKKIGGVKFLAQGTLYPDLIESRSAFGGPSAVIKTHHNVGGLPDRMKLKLIEPLKHLFKDEVRALGKELKMPASVLWRQPFPGPGLAVRIIGSVTKKRLSILKEVDVCLIEEIKKAGFYHRLWQSFAVLLPIRSVGIMGDERTYENVAAIRAVTSNDAMTADWARLPHELLARISNRIVNEVKGVNRVVYDISSKPPSTIEWE